MRYLVTGSNGRLGTKVIEQLLARSEAKPLGASRGPCTNGYLGAFSYWPLDVADAASVEKVVGGARPDVVIHTAAKTDVDGSERERDEARAENVDGAANVARACAARHIHLVHVSTEYVFDGTSGPYREDDATNPLGWYATTKYQGELAVQEVGTAAAIARTTVIYGYARHRRPDFVLWLLGQLRAGRRVRVIHDQIGSPTLADNLAQMLLALADGRATGVYNTVGATVIGRYDFARLAADTFGLDPELIEPINTATLNQAAPRPLNAGLLMDKFRAAFPNVHVLTAAEGVRVLREQLTAAGLP